MSGLSVENLVKRFKTETVLDGVSFDVPAGETLVLFGPSGSGKTVLLRCIAGAIEPEEGDIRIGGEIVNHMLPEKRGVGMAFQNFALFPHMSAFDNIASPLKARRTRKAQLKEGVEKVAKLLKIDHVLGHAPKELSNGQKQRTALARALAAEPGLLLLDDPLRNVDAKLRFEMRLELPRLLADRGATVLYVTQDYKEAMALGDRIAVLDGGRIVQIGTAEDVYYRPATIEIARLFGDPVINLLDVVPKLDTEGVYVEISDTPVLLDAPIASAVGKECVVGIRPEALQLCPAGTEGAIPVTIEAETPLNEKTVTLSVTKRGREILTSRPAGTPAPNSGEAGLLMHGTEVVLFDRETGHRIRGDEDARAAA